MALGHESGRSTLARCVARLGMLRSIGDEVGAVEQPDVTTSTQPNLWRGYLPRFKRHRDHRRTQQQIRVDRSCSSGSPSTAEFPRHHRRKIGVSTHHATSTKPVQKIAAD